MGQKKLQTCGFDIPQIADCMNTRHVLDFEIGNRGCKTAKKLFTKLEQNYKIDSFATDHWSVYYQTIPPEKHITGKKFTQGIENLNGRIRHYLSGFARRTKDYFKSEQTMKSALNLLFYHST